MGRVFCTRCGRENDGAQSFCIACGNKLVDPNAESGSNGDPTELLERCQVCGAPRTPNRLFCSNCGTRYGAAGQAAGSPAGVDAQRTAVMPASMRQQYVQARRVYDQGARPVIPRDVIADPAPMRTRILAALAGLAIVAAVVAVIVFVIKPFDSGSGSQQAASSEATSLASGSSQTGTSEKPTSSDSGTASGQAASSAAATAGTASSASAATSKSGSSQASSSSAAAAASGYIIADSDSRYYSESELKKYSDLELYRARNEIYARHGRGFKNSDLQEYFDKQSWYKRTVDPDDFDSSVLNDYERKNAELMLKVEKARGSKYV